jgi:hypothetical protein
MSATYHHTTEEEIKQIAYFLQFFRPNELGFLLDAGSKWSRFDPDRITKITSLFNRTFDTSHSWNVVLQTLTFFGRNQSLCFSNKFRSDEIMCHQLEPFREDCPVCGSDLYALRATVKSVKMYCLRGRMIESTFRGLVGLSI